MKAWLKGGLIVLLISSLGILPDIIRSLLNIAYENFIFSVLLYGFFSFPGEVLVEILDKDPIRTTNETIIILILSFIFWFIIGALIGLLISKLKQKKGEPPNKNLKYSH